MPIKNCAVVLSGPHGGGGPPFIGGGGREGVREPKRFYIELVS